MVRSTGRYHPADTAQQVVGGFLLAGPFVVTEEVWVLAANMSVWHGLVVTGIVVAIGYGALYGADDDRDPDEEADVAGVPVRFLSLMVVSFGSVTVLALTITAPETFVPGILDGRGQEVTDVAVAATTAKAVAIGSIFSVVGAATADSVF